MIRSNQRALDQLRPVFITPDYTEMAAGSVLIECGRTKVICTASVEEGVPPFLKGKGQGWLTAEYSMLPGSTDRRKSREFLKRDGRSVEIQRLIGRSLRACCDLSRLGERTVYIDCDVIQADGGTRTASITGSFVALCLAVDRLMKQGALIDSPVTKQLAAVSCGVVDDDAMLDLEYAEDHIAQADCNLVMTREAATGKTEFVEVQMTGEGRTIRREEFFTLLELGEKGVLELMQAQTDALDERAQVIGRKPRLVVASGNFGKLKEMRILLGDKFDVVSMKELGLDPDIDENGDTFEANALIKAEALMKLTGCATIADDSGLGGRAGRQAGCVLGALFGRTRRRRGQQRQAARGAQGRARREAYRPLCLRDGAVPAGQGAADRARNLRGTHTARAARRGRLRLRPAVPVRRLRQDLRRGHDGGEKRRLPSRAGD